MSDSKAADISQVEKLHKALTTALLERIQNGEATPADLNAARAFLKDNNVTAVVAENGPLLRLAETLPAFDDEDMSYAG